MKIIVLLVLFVAVLITGACVAPAVPDSVSAPTTYGATIMPGSLPPGTAIEPMPLPPVPQTPPLPSWALHAWVFHP